MTRPSKLHRGYERVDYRGLPLREPACGIVSRAPVLTGAEFQWLPRERQCELCLSHFYPVGFGPRAFANGIYHDGTMPGVKSMTDEMRIALDHFFLSFARLCLDLVELGPDWRHRCWFDAGRRGCACGRYPSVLRVHELLRDAGDRELGSLVRLATIERVAKSAPRVVQYLIDGTVRVIEQPEPHG